MAESEFHRIRRLPPYVFAEVNRLKAEARAAGRDVIDFGMGNPDMASPPHVVQKLIETVQDPRTHRYSNSRGIPGLRKAIAGYYARRFQVEVDPESEVIVTLGSKEGLANLAQAITSPGDVVLVPNPSYPIHAFGFVIAGAAIRHIPPVPPQDFVAAVERAYRHSVPAPIALIVNYPSNPTAELRDLNFYGEVVDFARSRGLYVLSDLAYGEIYFGDRVPPSILQIPGARDIAVEFGSLSKTYSMPGWRIGYAVGCKKLIAALARVKSYLDYGAFTPIQVAAIAALNGPQDCVAQYRATYKRRRDVLIEGLNSAGWPVPAPEASMFAWAPLPERYRDLGSLEFSKLLLEQAQVAVAPGIGFGEYGDGHVRLGLVENTDRIRQAVRNIRHMLHAQQDGSHRSGHSASTSAITTAANPASWPSLPGPIHG